LKNKNTMKHTKCPSCHGENLYDFFTIKNAPVHSLVTITSFEDADKIERKDIELTLCKDCGFIFNSAFDTSLDYYTKGYEDQQGFSPTFMKWITGVTQRVIDKYDLNNKDIIEIGCGKGDFINLISDLGNNRGVGIDPAFEFGRFEPKPNVRFIKEFYSESHGDLPADCISCRHTLEHIHDTFGFISTVRKSIRDKKNVLVFMEIPDITRILTLPAFWDIFYEHCTYLSPGSLARLFRKAGFEVVDLYREYGDQYLLIEAKPVDGISEKIHPLEESVEDMEKLVSEFQDKMNKQLSEWREILQGYKAKGEKTVVWGGGSKSVGFLTNFADINLIDYVVDINPHFKGNFIPGIGKQYVDPDFLVEYKPDNVIIMNPVYTEEIRKMLNEKGLNPNLIGLEN